MSYYNLINYDCPGRPSLAAEMANHDAAISWGVELMENTPGPTELTYTKFPDGRLVVRILNEEKMFVKIESI